MIVAQISKLLENIRALKPVVVGEPIPTRPMTLTSTVLPPVSWDRNEIEESLGVGLPSELVSLWENTSGLRLFEDKPTVSGGLSSGPPRKLLKEIRLRKPITGDRISGWATS
jgi:hypothetical protein